MMVGQRKKFLFQQLDLSGLNKCSDRNQVDDWTLLAEYHDIFSPEPGEVGCTGLVKHEIRVVDDELFKERFQMIPPLMVDEVHAHIKEMLQVGTICPSQSPWCYAVVLVCKKDGGPFALTFTSSMPGPRSTPICFPEYRNHRKALLGRMFLLSRSKSRLLANHHGWSFKTMHHFHCRKLGIFQVWCMPFGLCNVLATFQRLMQNCLGELNLTYCLIYLDNVIVFSKTEGDHLKHLYIVFDHFWELNLRLKPTKVWIPLGWD